jgi:hypothetical protein
MNPKPLFTAVVCLLLFTFVSYAQPQAPPAFDFAQMRKTPMFQQNMKMGVQTAVRSFWDGRGTNLMAVGLLQDPDTRVAFGVSDEQYQSIQDFQPKMMVEMQKNPEFLKIMGEMQAIQNPNDPFLQNANEETRKKLLDIQGRIMSLSMNLMSDVIDNTLTAEQKQKMAEAQLAIMEEMPMISPSIFEVLNLTDAQKQQMEGIKKELEPEFEKNLETFADDSVILANKMFDEMEKQGGFEELFGNPANIQKRMPEFQEKIQTMQKKLLEDPEYKRIHDRVNSQSQAFSTQLKTKMFDVLTDEQWARLQKLIDSPPEHAKLLAKKMKEQKAASEKAGAWQPGPNSWKPGDPIPEQYRQERRERTRQRAGFAREESP